VKAFQHVQPNAQGKLLLSFVPVKNYANISAIEVLDEGQIKKGEAVWPRPFVARRR